VRPGLDAEHCLPVCSGELFALDIAFYRTRHNAYRNESYTYEGLNFPYFSLWHYGMTESERNAEIDKAAAASDAAAEPEE
jgi:hypothetical protein